MNKRSAKDVQKNLGKERVSADSVQELPRNQLVKGSKRVQNNACHNHNVQLAELPCMCDIDQRNHCENPPQNTQHHRHRPHRDELQTNAT